MQRIMTRTALILLAAGLVVLATAALVPQAKPKPAWSQAARLATGDPIPGGEAAVRRAIHDMDNRRRPRQQWLAAALGPLRGLAYKGADMRGDLYVASFAKGSLLWKVSADDGGKIAGLTFAAPQGPTPQDWIDNYALTAPAPRILVLVFSLIKILFVVGAGRVVGIRL